MGMSAIMLELVGRVETDIIGNLIVMGRAQAGLGTKLGCNSDPLAVQS